MNRYDRTTGAGVPFDYPQMLKDEAEAKRKKTRKKIKWHRSQDGFCASKCARFKIKPIYAGRCQPIWFEVTDTVPGGFGKEWVEHQLNPPKDDRDWPEITEDML